MLFRILRDHCSFLTRSQIQRVLGLTASGTSRTLHWLMAEEHLARRYRADSFNHFQTPVYYLGELGWSLAGKPAAEYKRYRSQVEHRAERQIDHMLAVYDVLLKFMLEADVKRIIGWEDRLWQEAIDFGNVPDAWIEYAGGEAFIEVDCGTERPTVLAKKFDKYVAYNASGRYARLFPDCDFKVLVFANSEERIEALEQQTTSDDIWFCSMEEFLREELGHEHWFAYLGFYALPVAAKKEVP